MTAPLAASRGPKWGTSLITFFHPTFFGLPAETSYPAYVEAAYADPRAYFDRMLDASRDAGLAGVELAPVPAGYEGALKAYGSVACVQAACADRGLRIASSYMEGGHLIRPGLQDGQGRAEAAALVDEHARFLAGVGCELIVMGTLPRLEFGDAAYGDVPPDIHGKVADELNRLGSIAQRQKPSTGRSSWSTVSIRRTARPVGRRPGRRRFCFSATTSVVVRSVSPRRGARASCNPR